MEDVEMTMEATHSGSEETGSRKRSREATLNQSGGLGDLTESFRQKSRRVFGSKERWKHGEGCYEHRLAVARVEAFAVTCEVQRVEQAMQQTIHRQICPGMQLTGVPLFIAAAMAREGFIKILLPDMFGKSVRDAVRADPSVANLRELHPLYYTLGVTVNRIVQDQTLDEYLKNVFQHRLESIVHEVARMAAGAAEHKLTDEELRVARRWKKLWACANAGRSK